MHERFIISQWEQKGKKSPGNNNSVIKDDNKIYIYIIKIKVNESKFLDDKIIFSVLCMY